MATRSLTWARNRSRSSALAIRISVDASKTIIMTKYDIRNTSTRDARIQDTRSVMELVQVWQLAWWVSNLDGPSRSWRSCDEAALRGPRPSDVRPADRLESTVAFRPLRRTSVDLSVVINKS